MVDATARRLGAAPGALGPAEPAPQEPPEDDAVGQQFDRIAAHTGAAPDQFRELHEASFGG